MQQHKRSANKRSACSNEQNYMPNSILQPDMSTLSLRVNCKWCLAVKADPKLLKRIYKSKYYTSKKNAEPLKAISDSMGMQYPSLRKHCKFHQSLTDDELQQNQLERIAKRTTSAIISRNVKTLDARQTVIDRMFAKFEEGDFDDRMTIKDFLTAMKQADDVAAKQTDQGIDVLRMMQGVRSGEAQPAVREKIYEEYNPWDEENAV